MAINVQISCIDKPNRYDPHARIVNVGGFHNGARWVLPLDQAIASLQRGEYQFFVNENGRTVFVEVAHHNGRPYLKTVPNGTPIDNLLALSACSV